MKKAGKIIAAVFASICIVVSLITAVTGMGGGFIQDNPDLMKEGMEETGATMSDSEKEAMQATGEILMEIDFEKMVPQGIVGVILSVIVLVSVLINVPKMPILTPAIAGVAAIGGGFYCGWLILFFMAVALIGCVLVLIGNLQESKASSES